VIEEQTELWCWISRASDGLCARCECVDRFGYKLAIVDSTHSEECLLLVFENGAGLAKVWSALAPFHAQSPEDKQHWMSEQIPSCVRCNAAFSVTNRKHHCRQCGKLICKNCSMFTASQPPRSKAA
jgi:hypothetical protein